MLAISTLGLSFIYQELHGFQLAVGNGMDGDGGTRLILHGPDVADNGIAAKLFGVDQAAQRQIGHDTGAVHAAQLGNDLRHALAVAVQGDDHIQFVQPGQGYQQGYQQSQGHQQNYQQSYNQDRNSQEWLDNYYRYNDAFASGPTGKSRGVTALLALFLGTLGVQYFYLGKITAGILTILLSLVTCGVWSVIVLIQGIMMLVMDNYTFQQKFVLNNSTFPIF